MKNKTALNEAEELILKIENDIFVGAFAADETAGILQMVANWHPLELSDQKSMINGRLDKVMNNLTNAKTRLTTFKDISSDNDRILSLLEKCDKCEDEIDRIRDIISGISAYEAPKKQQRYEYETPEERIEQKREKTEAQKELEAEEHRQRMAILQRRKHKRAALISSQIALPVVAIILSCMALISDEESLGILVAVVICFAILHFVKRWQGGFLSFLRGCATFVNICMIVTTFTVFSRGTGIVMLAALIMAYKKPLRTVWKD